MATTGLLGKGRELGLRVVDQRCDPGTWRFVAPSILLAHDLLDLYLAGVAKAQGLAVVGVAQPALIVDVLIRQELQLARRISLAFLLLVRQLSH